VLYYRHFGDTIEAVLIDMVMPVMDGHSCFLKLHELDPEVKVVLSTGFGLNEAAQRAGYYKEMDDLRAALEESDVVYTDTWIDMEFFTDPSFAQEKERRIQLFQPYQLNREILADLDLRIMHCLPAHRGFEIAGELIDDPRSVLFAQAENRLHSQKAVLLKLAAERV